MTYPDPPPETFGQRLKRLAKAKGYTNRALAKETGAHETTVARWMMGTVPEGPTLAILIRLLDVSLDYLLKPRAPTEPATPKPASAIKKVAKRHYTRTGAARKRRKGSE